MKPRTNVSLLITADDEPNIGVMICHITPKTREIQFNQELLKEILEEHFDAEITLKEVQELTQYPAAFRALAVVDDGCSIDEMVINLNETWIYE